MTITLLSLTIIVLVIGYFWWEGHEGAWGKVAKKYPLNDDLEVTGEFNNSVEVSKKSVWNAVNITITDAGIYLVVEPWFTWACPSIKIPWEAVQSVKQNDRVFSKKTDIYLSAGDDTISIPGEFYKICSDVYSKSISNKSA